MTKPRPLRKITVLLVDDNAVVRARLCMLLAAAGQTEVVGQARNGREAVKLTRTLQPNVILMDIAMPVLNGFDATEQILATNHAAKVLILSAHGNDAYVERAAALGAVGFVSKLTASTKLADAICAVAKGNRFFSPAILKRMQLRGGPRPRSGLLKQTGKLTNATPKVQPSNASVVITKILN